MTPDEHDDAIVAFCEPACPECAKLRQRIERALQELGGRDDETEQEMMDARDYAKAILKGTAQ